MSSRSPAPARAEQLRHALGLYHGEALVEDASALWAERLRRDVHVAYFACAHQLAEASVEFGDHYARAEAYQSILVIDEYDQRAHLGLIDALSRLGAHGHVTRARAQYVSRMADLGIDADSSPATVDA
ncbi:bacterial transcriptional activator domain-containing protein [Microbacterium sp. NIBRBAC000506063]|uniref:bacterial transcriptional activator domain-containing protein n=1 Tax=Microbacterium sp. NIBRBAC000506063 TaxID=2734618 RepID=UPI001BB77AF8|nr:bacterial transcriptional activator domain-containing protein [Microbacterium sp. NIBRBAC000506063]QTV80335.1 bacterial transcriptional activator domain-containing protein [Microbacterium sp. NIBRBAC000506063]